MSAELPNGGPLRASAFARLVVEPAVVAVVDRVDFSAEAWVIVAVVVAWSLATVAAAWLSHYYDWPPARPPRRGPAEHDKDVLAAFLASPRHSGWVVRPARGPGGAVRPAAEARLVWSDGALLPTIGLVTGQVTDTPLGDYLGADVLARYDRVLETGAPGAWREHFAGRELHVHVVRLPSGVVAGCAHDVTDLAGALAAAEAARDTAEARVEALMRFAGEEAARLFDGRGTADGPQPGGDDA